MEIKKFYCSSISQYSIAKSRSIFIRSFLERLFFSDLVKSFHRFVFYTDRKDLVPILALCFTWFTLDTSHRPTILCKKSAPRAKSRKGTSQRNKSHKGFVKCTACVKFAFGKWNACGRWWIYFISYRAKRDISQCSGEHYLTFCIAKYFTYNRKKVHPVWSAPYIICTNY